MNTRKRISSKIHKDQNVNVSFALLDCKNQKCLRILRHITLLNVSLKCDRILNIYFIYYGSATDGFLIILHKFM